MFRPSLERLQAWIELADDVLGDPSADAQPPAAQLHTGEPARPRGTHPHRRALRWQRARRPGTVPAAPAHCLSPVRASGQRGAAERVRS